MNVPMVEGLLSEPGLTVCWTRIWRNSYGRLFKTHRERDPAAAQSTVSAAGPDSSSEDPQGTRTGVLDEQATQRDVGGLVFKFGPDMTDLINPAAASVPIGTDGWAIRKGWVSVTPMCATFAEPVEWVTESEEDMESKVWRLKL